MMQLGEFVDLVSAMRLAQASYFKTKQGLDQCRQLERLVDRAIERFRDQQGTLWGEDDD